MATPKKKAGSSKKRSSKKRGARGATVKSIPDSPPRVSLAAYARHRGVSKTAVQKAVREGRLKDSFTKVGVRYQFDVEAADREWDGSTDYLRHPTLQLVGSTNVDDALSALGNPDLNKVRILKEFALAEEARLRVKEKEGQLVSATEAERLRFGQARQVRDAFSAFPARVAAEVAALTDKKQVEILIERAIHEALEDLADDLARTAIEGASDAG